MVTKNLLPYLFLAKKLHKIEMSLFTKLSKIWVWDPGSGKNLFRIPDPGPGVKMALDPGSATLRESLKSPKNKVAKYIVYKIVLCKIVYTESHKTHNKRIKFFVQVLIKDTKTGGTSGGRLLPVEEPQCPAKLL
jgi:hypothetical protein